MKQGSETISISEDSNTQNENNFKENDSDILNNDFISGYAQICSIVSLQNQIRLMNMKLDKIVNEQNKMKNSFEQENQKRKEEMRELFEQEMQEMKEWFKQKKEEMKEWFKQAKEEIKKEIKEEMKIENLKEMIPTYIN